MVIMTFNFTINSKDLSSFLDSMVVVLSDGFLEVTKSGLQGKGLNASNSIYVDTAFPMEIIGCDDHRLAVDFSRILSVTPSGDKSVELSLEGNDIIMKSGKTNYKFRVLSPNAVREVRTPKLSFDKIINGIKPDDLHSSIRAIEQYNKDSERYYKCQIIWEDDIFRVTDNFGDVSTDISYESSSVTDKRIVINASTDLLIDVAAHMKKYESSIQIGLLESDNPFMIASSKSTYFIAPRVEAD